jgi:hypothetical protein
MKLWKFVGDFPWSTLLVVEIEARFGQDEVGMDLEVIGL